MVDHFEFPRLTTSVNTQGLCFKFVAATTKSALRTSNETGPTSASDLGELIQRYIKRINMFAVEIECLQLACF